MPHLNSTNITVSTPAQVPTPASGFVTHFFNANDNGNLWYKDDAGNVFQETDASVCSEAGCACQIAKRIVDSAGCALNDGLMTPTEYTNAIQMTITENSTVDANTGERTTTITITASA